MIPMRSLATVLHMQGVRIPCIITRSYAVSLLIRRVVKERHAHQPGHCKLLRQGVVKYGMSRSKVKYHFACATLIGALFARVSLPISGDVFTEGGFQCPGCREGTTLSKDSCGYVFDGGSLVRQDLGCMGWRDFDWFRLGGGVFFLLHNDRDIQSHSLFERIQDWHALESSLPLPSHRAVQALASPRHDIKRAVRCAT